MNISFLFARHLAVKQKSSFSKFITNLSIVATALSVMAMITTLSLVNGFQEKVSNKVFCFWGHLHVQHFDDSKSLISEESPITNNDTILNIIKLQQNINSVSIYATKSAVIEKNKSIEGVLIKGINFSTDSMNFKNFIIKGRWLNFIDSNYSKEIILSEPVAKALKIKINDTTTVNFISSKQGTANSFRKLVVVGIFKTGIEEYDKLFAITDIKLLQRLNNWQQNQIGGYEIFLNDYKLMDTTSSQLSNLLPTQWVSRTTKEVYPNIFDWLNIQDVNRNVIFIIMSVVAIINLITCLLVLVLERTRMIGILKALGSTNWMIQKIFLFQAAFITLIGISLGALIGLGFCFLQDATHFIKLDETSYYVSYAPVKIIGWQVALICLLTAIVCFVSLIAPTVIIKKLSPVKAIQFK